VPSPQIPRQAMYQQERRLNSIPVKYGHLALPKSKQQSPEWQAAAEALMMPAEDRGPLMHAHVGMMLALHGTKPIPEYDSSKERHWGRRKLKRDEW
jgi:hypothetical protein